MIIFEIKHFFMLVSSSNNHETSKQSSQEPTTEIKEGVEWVSFVYSHHRTLRRYCIRTDLDKVDTQLLDEKFKKENCVRKSSKHIKGHPNFFFFYE